MMSIRIHIEKARGEGLEQTIRGRRFERGLFLTLSIDSFLSKNFKGSSHVSEA
jgi:hypothetical protein